MPIFYQEHPAGTSTKNEGNGVHGHDARLPESPSMLFRPSMSPDIGTTTFKTEHGRPLSRGELIERLKSNRTPTRSFEKDLKSPLQPGPGKVSIEEKNSALTSSSEPQDTTRRSSSDDQYSKGLDIERPRSALHSGDFRQERDSSIDVQDFSSPFSNPPPDEAHQNLYSIFGNSQAFEQRPRSRSGHNPLLPNFQFLPPTSPLIHASNNPDLDRQTSPSPVNRRHTFSPQLFQTAHSASASPSPARSIRPSAYQAHQPRRSISIPQTPRLRPRGVSTSSEASPLHHAPMVGSYEESILRGRMSTTPSRPLDFIAQIGVLGRGKCKPSLRCPPHVTTTFPAVFYSYNSIGRPAAMDNSPSPYVGLVDIENSFPPYEGGKVPPGGGCYRIPQQGQLQIIIKNPNKTAVKLFLVPYDLSDMEPGQKTFIRQRSYSAGPIIDMPMSSRKNLGTDRPEAAISHSEDPMDRPMLRYLVHLHICCPANGRYFLYRSIRVVFANRVPDGKENLRNEVQLPEPRYSPYKPSEPGSSASPRPPKKMKKQQQQQKPLQSTRAEDDRTARRRSTPFSFGMLYNLDTVDGLGSMPPPPTRPVGIMPQHLNHGLRSIPHGLSQLDTLVSRPTSRDQMDVDGPEKETIDGEELQRQDSNVMKYEGNNSVSSQSPFETWRNRRWNPSESPRDV